MLDELVDLPLGRDRSHEDDARVVGLRGKCLRGGGDP
jgi:hypothetical protein